MPHPPMTAITIIAMSCRVANRKSREYGTFFSAGGGTAAAPAPTALAGVAAPETWVEDAVEGMLIATSSFLVVVSAARTGLST